MIKEQFKKNPILWIFIILCVAGYSYYQWLKTLPQDYTIGTIGIIAKPLKGGEHAEYTYSINGVDYKESRRVGSFESYAQEGKRYLVEYPEGHESEGVILFDHPVPDGIEAPPGGWDEKPVFKRRTKPVN